jgi:hypothetical protein
MGPAPTINDPRFTAGLPYLLPLVLSFDADRQRDLDAMACKILEVIRRRAMPWPRRMNSKPCQTS